MASKFQLQIRDFRWLPARQKISQITAITIDYQKLHDWWAKRLYYHFRLSVVVAVARVSFFELGFFELDVVENPVFAVGTVILSVSARYVTISGFGSHIAISGCRSLSQSLGDTLFGLARAENPEVFEFRRYLLYFRWHNYFRFWWPYHYFRLSFDVIDTCWHFLRAPCGQKPQFCRQNCSDICHTVGDISTSGLDSHIAISGWPSISHLFVDTFFEFGVVEDFVYRSRITVILIFQIYSAVWVCDYDYVLSLDDDVLLLPVLSVVLKMYKVPFFILLVILPFSVCKIQQCHICEVYIFMSQAYIASSRKTSHVDIFGTLGNEAYIII